MNPGDISDPPHNGMISYCHDQTFNSYYETEKALGAGGQGQIDLARIRTSGKVVVIKRLMLYPNTDLKTVPELVMLDRVQKLGEHENLIRYHQIWNTPAEPGECPTSRIILPYISGGDLKQLRESFDKMQIKVPEAFIWHAFKQMAAGFGFLHENGISHRDIKPQNIMVDYPHFLDPVLFPTLKIIDFGIACDTTEDHNTQDGTPKWQPPEAPIAGAKADVWAVGATVHYLATGCATKVDNPSNMTHHRVTDWFREQPVYVRRIVDDADFEAGTQTLTEAREATFTSLTPLPHRRYSSLLEYYMIRALDRNASTRITLPALNASLPSDADRQIAFYKAWFRQCKSDGSQRPMLTFAMIEPPPGWAAADGSCPPSSPML